MKVFFICLVLLFACPFAGAQWVQTNGPGGGIINDVISDGTTLYAATFGDGVYRSDDDGISWVRGNTGLPDLHINTMAIREDMVLAGTFRDGIFLSTHTIILEVCEVSGDAHLSIFNANGQNLLDLPITDLQKTVDLSTLTAGVYFLRYGKGDTLEVEKLIKE